MAGKTQRKKNKKNKKNKQGGGGGIGRTAGSLFAADFAGEVVGNVIGALLAEGLQNYMSGPREKDKKPPGGSADPDDDLASRLLKVLAERGPLSIPDLMSATGVALSPLLAALHTVRDFRLVEFVGEADDGDCVVQLTRNGSRTVTVIQKDGMRREAARLLGSEEVRP
jgi:hypothetical protein